MSRFRVQAWRYGPPGPSVYGPGWAFAVQAEAVHAAAHLFGLRDADFAEPPKPLLIEDLAADACEACRNLAIVNDDEGFVVAHAELPSGVTWPAIREA